MSEESKLTPPHLGLRQCTIDQILADAQEESGGDAEESVLINYSLLLELVDGYKAAGWVR